MSTRAELPDQSRRSRRRRWRTAAALGSLTALAAGAFATNGGPFASNASSHREAPLIAGDPRADNTDLYAFTSPDDPSMVTIISNWIPSKSQRGTTSTTGLTATTNTSSRQIETR